MKNVKVVIFDCDGVMFDSRNANEAYYNHILTEFGKPEMDQEQSDYSHMHTGQQSVTHLFKDDRRQEEALAYYQRMSYVPFIPLMEMEPYLKGFLKYLRPAYKTAISTNRSDTTKPVLVHHDLDELFDFVVSCLDVKNPKPHPESLLKILDHFGVSCEEAIYIGDSPIDEQAARAAGVPLIAYKSPELSAAYHVSHFKEIEEILERSTKTG
jgi:HAD superfamily hydrolase (TIGR01509 family)